MSVSLEHRCCCIGPGAAHTNWNLTRQCGPGTLIRHFAFLPQMHLIFDIYFKQCQRSIRNFEFWLQNFSWQNSIWNLQTLGGAQINLAQFFSMYQFHTLQLPVGSKLELNNFVANRPRSSCWAKLAKFQLNFQRRLSPNQLLLILLFLLIASKTNILFI